MGQDDLAQATSSYGAVSLPPSQSSSTCTLNQSTNEILLRRRLQLSGDPSNMSPPSSTLDDHSALPVRCRRSFQSYYLLAIGAAKDGPKQAPTFVCNFIGGVGLHNQSIRSGNCLFISSVTSTRYFDAVPSPAPPSSTPAALALHVEIHQYNEAKSAALQVLRI